MLEKESNRQVRIKQWAEKLTPEQSVKLIVELVEWAFQADVVNFFPNNLAPYWDSCGEPIVEGQKVREEDNG